MLKFIDFPRRVSHSKYENAIHKMTEKIKKYEGVLSVFLVGGINSPGISDIDILVIFEDNAECNFDPLKNLTAIDRYLFIHGLYGLSEKYLKELMGYNFFKEYKPIYGDSLPEMQSVFSEEIMTPINTQTALEYFIKMYITLTIQRTYGVIKTRGLLLHVNALLYDMKMLEISSGRLWDIIQEMVTRRSEWFHEIPGSSQLNGWVDSFYSELNKFLISFIAKHKFYLQKKSDMKIGKNITIMPSDEFGFSHTGFTLPPVIGGLGRKSFNIQNRFNHFIFNIPVCYENIPDAIIRRDKFISEIKAYNSTMLPYFTPAPYGLSIY